MINPHTGKNDHARRAAHREAVSGTVIHSIFDTWHYAVLWTCAVTRLLWYACDYVRLILYITLHTTNLKLSCQMHFIALKYALKYTPDCTRLHTPSQLDCTLPSKLSRHSQIHLPVRSQVYSEYAPKYTEYAPKYTSEYALNYTPEHAVKYGPDCTRWHTPSLLDCTLPSKLSRHSQVHLQVRSQVHLRVALKYTLKYVLKYAPNSQLHSMVHSQPTWLYAPEYTLKREDTPNLT